MRIELIIKRGFKNAFTLVELLVVIAIIGILSGLIIVGMSSSVQSANVAKGQIFDSSLRDSLLSGLVSEWKLDGVTAVGSAATTGDAIDNWGSNNVTAISATVKGGADCVYNKCLSLNGTSDYIEIAHNSSLEPVNATFSLWVKPIQWNNNSTASALMTKRSAGGNGYFILYLNTSDSLQFDWGGSAYRWDTGYLPPLNTWTQIVFSRDASKRYIYANGVLQNSTTNVGATVASGAILRFGEDSSSAQYWYKGLLDNIRLYNTAITAAQIREQYYVGLNRLLANGKMLKEEYINRILN